ncbi:MAG: Co2+/Mg2+ efflux protein ApaG [Bacteroidota bacterium]|jgi:ApaG protein
MEESLITNGIKISVKHRYRLDLSCPHKGQYIFTYAITIENQSPNAVQLMHRHWFIHDSQAPMQTRQVSGEGVVGCQPIVPSGKQYRYESWCHLLSDLGKMHGFYTFVRPKDGAELKIPIPEFRLIVPWRLN